MIALYVIAIITSHTLAAYPFWAKIGKRMLPTTIDFAMVSIFLCYDIGLALESFGYSQGSPFFESLLLGKPSVLIQALIILVLAPWLLRIGSLLINKSSLTQEHASLLKIQNARRPLFYLLAGSLSVLLAGYGYYQFIHSDSIWVSRANMGSTWGPFIIILYLPIYILAFYIKQEDSRTRAGKLFSLFLIIASILSTITIGERTTVLLPFLIIAIFAFKLTPKRIIVYGVIGIVVSSTLLTMFKWQYSDVDYSLNELVMQTIYSDVSRGHILAATLERTESVGTSIMPYPMAGYVYSSLFFMPRQITPFKGYATATYFTSDIVGTQAEDIDWGFGVGAVEEILLNIGFWLCFPALIIYGLLLGILDRVSWRTSSLVVPTRLAGLWLCAHQLPAILLLFGAMALVNLVLHRLFVRPISLDSGERLSAAGSF